MIRTAVLHLAGVGYLYPGMLFSISAALDRGVLVSVHAASAVVLLADGGGDIGGAVCISVCCYSLQQL